MKTFLPMPLLAALSLTSCVVPIDSGYSGNSGYNRYDSYDGPQRRNPARSPYSPGGTAVLPRERNPRSPYSPGGSVILPREARRTVYRGNDFYVHRDVWYRRGGNGYVIVRRPY